jgi:hypothetical protein
MVISKIFRDSTDPYVHTTEDGDFEHMVQVTNTWLSQTPDRIVDIIFEDGGLMHIEDSEDESKACQWHWKNRQITVYRDGNQTVLIRGGK